ncbi:MAG: hypothetical protein ACUVX9_05145 [Anaerolineae bacterium]
MSRLNAMLQRSPLIGLLLGLAVGLGLGLFLAWTVWPAKYQPPTPADLSDAWRRSYVSAIADSFAQTGDVVTARERLEGLLYEGYDAAALANEIRLLAQQQAVTQPDAAARLSALAGVLQSPAPLVEPVPETPVTTTAPTSDALARMLRIAGTVLLVLVVLAGLLLLVYFLQARTVATTEGDEVEAQLSTASAAPRVAPSQPRVTPQPRAAAPEPPAATPTAPTVVREPVAEAAPPAGATALGPYVATYNLGDIDFDMSFGIEATGGDFLGECGLGMAETIGAGDVQRVTAFEVWLFDKTDIRTVSLVLASAHAHGDPALRAKLSSRGEVVLAERGANFAVKTSTLRLEGRVLDLAYGGGDGPAQSYFTSLSVELRPVLLSGGD